MGLRGGTDTFTYTLNVTSTIYTPQINSEAKPRFPWPLAS
jgi:hypothetical protein